MVNRDLVVRLISTVQANWEQVLTPKAPRDQWRQEIQALFPDYPVWNWTDFNYDKCHTYSVVLRPGPLKKPGSREEEATQLAVVGGKLAYLWVAISVVAPFVRVWTQTRALAPNGEILLQISSGAGSAAEVEAIRRFMDHHGLEELPEDVLRVVIPEIALDLKPRGEVTIYNCLFYDEG